jgi:hypothetical protein
MLKFQLFHTFFPWGQIFFWQSTDLVLKTYISTFVFNNKIWLVLFKWKFLRKEKKKKPYQYQVCFRFEINSIQKKMTIFFKDIIYWHHVILNQANQESSMIQFETFILYRSHLWNHLKWITTFLFHIKHVSDFKAGIIILSLICDCWMKLFNIFCIIIEILI